MHFLGKSAILHSMSQSATTLREERRLATERRIHRCALRLTDERGLDGFTLDDLAEAAEVSRRTLFNYYPGKIDAVLGPAPTFPEDALATFRAGGPHGDLVDDIAVAARHVLATQDLSREDVEVGRRVMLATPRLLAAAHERFELVADELADHLLEREGAEFGADRARLLLHVLVSLYDATLLTALGRPGPGFDLGDAYATTLQTLRKLLA